MQFDSLDDIRAFCRDLPGGDVRAAENAALRQQVLTKPPGSLGLLEELTIWLACWQCREIPQLERVTIAVFAGNHGIAARGVSAYPQAVTAQMVANFAGGGAAINQIASLGGAELRVVPIELDRPTRDFTIAPAMDVDEFLAAVEIGYRTVPPDSDLLAVGEMGIANTTTAATLCAALLGGGAGRWPFGCGAGRFPATPAWLHSPKLACPARAGNGALPHDGRLITWSRRLKGAAHDANGRYESGFSRRRIVRPCRAGGAGR